MAGKDVRGSEGSHGKFYVVSLGPMIDEYIVPKARRVIDEADEIYLMTKEGSRTHQLVSRLVGDRTINLFMPDNLLWGQWGKDQAHADFTGNVESQVRDGKSVALLIFGDVSIYSPFGYISEYLKARGIPYELVPGIPYFLAAGAVTGDYLVRDDGNLLVAGAPNIENLDEAFAAASTIVLYAIDRPTVRRIRAYAMANGLVRAESMVIGSTGEESKVVDLIRDGEPKNPGQIILKRRSDQKYSVGSYTVPLGAGGEYETRRCTTKDGVYCTRGDEELRYTCWLPHDENPVPAVALFHGGGWQVGNRHQFAALGKLLSALGCALFSFDYRLHSTHGTSPVEAVQDAGAALQWLSRHAAGFNVDPSKIVLGGASAGGHIAVGQEILEEVRDSAAYGKPVAYILYNPVTETSEQGYGKDHIQKTAGEDYVDALDIMKNLDNELPPTILFHGTADELVPVQNTFDFEEKALQYGTDVRMHIYPDLPHGFFNHRFQGTNRYFYETTERIVEFLVSLGLLDPQAVEQYRLIRKHDDFASVADLAETNQIVTRGLAALEADLSDVQAILTDLEEQEVDVASARKQIERRITPLHQKLNRLQAIHSYSVGPTEWRPLAAEPKTDYAYRNVFEPTGNWRRERSSERRSGGTQSKPGGGTNRQSKSAAAGQATAPRGLKEETPERNDRQAVSQDDSPQNGRGQAPTGQDHGVQFDRGAQARRQNERSENHQSRTKNAADKSASKSTGTAQSRELGDAEFSTSQQTPGEELGRNAREPDRRPARNASIRRGPKGLLEYVKYKVLTGRLWKKRARRYLRVLQK